MQIRVQALCGVLTILLFSLVPVSLAAADDPRDIAKRVSPSVVLLVVEDSGGQPLAMGSGFVVRKGVVATNMHVIEGAARAYAKLVDDKTKYNIAGVVASDAKSDLVLLSADGLGADALVIGDSDGVAAGDTVYAIGNPRGLEGTFSAGIVSSVRKVGEDSLLQITAPISPGSSGGPVVNGKGEVVGVAVATFDSGQNLNFAIPSRYLSALIPAIKDPVALPKAAEVQKAKKEKSILDGAGAKGTEGVTAAQFLWDEPILQDGGFTISLRNQFREPVANVDCLVVFYGEDGGVLDAVRVTLTSRWNGVIQPGLAKRVGGTVDESVQKLTTPWNGKAPKTRVEYRVLAFEFGADASVPNGGNNSAPGELLPVPAIPEPAVPEGDAPRDPPLDVRPADVAEALRKSEQELAETVAKLAPAGDGPDLIEAQIDGKFEGWDGETVFKLDNGQVWQQVTFGYTYHYAFRPKVFIIKAHGAYKMKVDGVDGTVFVKRVDPEVILCDRVGDPVAWIDRTDEMTIYLWSGKPVAYLSGKSVYGFNGEHLGWYASGSMYDGEGKIVAVTSSAIGAKPNAVPAKGAKGIKPIKAIKKLAPLEPLHKFTWSDLPTDVFLLKGAK